jgi:hypothetical protein
VLVNPIVVQFAAATGFMAAAIAVGGFIAHARPAMAGESEETLRRRTAAGGVAGLATAALMICAGIVL